MGDCGCQIDSKVDQRILKIALLLNLMMFIVGFLAGLIAQSVGLIADSLDMLADAVVYALGLIAIGRSLAFKNRVAKVSGYFLLILGVAVLFEVGRSSVMGSSPESAIIIAIAGISLIVNGTVLYLLSRYRHGEIHLQATWIFTRADVIANLGVIISGILVYRMNSHYPDLIIGFAISLYVLKESFLILKGANQKEEA